MGSTLTNTQPKDTYKSLLKTSDSSELSATAKYVSDGNGNDSPLALSNAKVGIGTTTPQGKLSVSSGAAGGGYNSDYDELVLTNAGRAGINILSSTTEYSAIIMGGAADNTTGGIYHKADTKMLSFATSDSFRMNITSGGNVGIGTTSPNRKLTVNGDSEFQDIVCTTSIYLGGTASANALDDYEEGTFTAVITGGTFSSLNTGRYTKIGRQVYWYLSPSATAITGNLTISSLPYVIADRSASLFATVAPSGITYAPQFHESGSAQCYINVSGTYIGGAVSTYFAGVYSV